MVARVFLGRPLAVHIMSKGGPSVFGISPACSLGDPQVILGGFLGIPGGV